MKYVEELVCKIEDPALEWAV